MQQTGKIGAVIDGKFRILSFIGSGGFSSVYTAEQLEFGRTVALKIIAEPTHEREERVERFAREAKILSTLHHPNIVPVYAYGATTNGERYLAMQFIEGETLSALLEREKKLPSQRAVHIGIQLCGALAAAHAEGIIHRDLKPLNIMIVDDVVKVLDFGLAGLTEGTPMHIQRLTQTGALIGTAHYMSPELCRGMRADFRSDIYSLGCVLYQCLAGKPMFEEDSGMEIVYRHATDLPPRLTGPDRDVPEWLERVVFKALQKQPEDRYQQVSEFAEALRLGHSGRHRELALDDVRLATTKTSLQTNSSRRTNKILLAMSTLIVCAVIAGGVFYYQQQSDKTNAARTGTTTGAKRLRSAELDTLETAPPDVQYATLRRMVQTGLYKYEPSAVEKALQLLKHNTMYADDSTPAKMRTKYCELYREGVEQCRAIFAPSHFNHDMNKAQELSLVTLYNRQQYDKALEIGRQMADRLIRYAPVTGNSEYKWDLSQAYYWQARSLVRKGGAANLGEAERVQALGVALIDSDDRRFGKWRSDWVTYKLSLAGILLLENTPRGTEQAIKLLKECEPAIRELDPALTAMARSTFGSDYQNAQRQIPQIQKYVDGVLTDPTR